MIPEPFKWPDDLLIESIYSRETIMTQKKWLEIAVFVLVLTMTLACSGIVNPPATFQPSDLDGTWEAYYPGRDVDRLMINADGTYQQVFDNGKGYVYISPWNEWRMERLPDGRVRLHLEGGRYYPEGIEIAEAEGMHYVPEGTSEELQCFREMPWSFHDSVTEEPLTMVGELILDVDASPSFPGGMALVHMQYDIDSGADEFYLIEIPIPTVTIAR